MRMYVCTEWPSGCYQEASKTAEFCYTLSQCRIWSGSFFIMPPIFKNLWELYHALKLLKTPITASVLTKASKILTLTKLPMLGYSIRTKGLPVSRAESYETKGKNPTTQFLLFVWAWPLKYVCFPPNFVLGEAMKNNSLTLSLGSRASSSVQFPSGNVQLNLQE